MQYNPQLYDSFVGLTWATVLQGNTVSVNGQSQDRKIYLSTVTPGSGINGGRVLSGDTMLVSSKVVVASCGAAVIRSVQRFHTSRKLVKNENHRCQQLESEPYMSNHFLLRYKGKSSE